MKVFLMVADQDNTKQWPIDDHWYAPITEYEKDLEDLEFGDVVIDNIKQEIHIYAWLNNI